ncbi:hypothetical protein COV93_04650 [Candidatus Woesearchaeota archaeon CG11_big_fil_rev_8_21_14_0_20_43_8]|nr:MAG: hypothetical protein COV93_04650 [Candidatus Woesearchaeota archaeon CG11_big_fil_rev_8_21_14_0_20_43_8]PIO05586.1 MAG: hypothetical protein COT47_04165 [Candidatus Woesearchaeota archaeon CG08_land_8_20_14_0_20_43_7]
MAKKGNDVEEGKPFAFLGVFLTIVGFLIVFLTKKENKYAMFYAKQGLVLFIAWVAVWVVGWVLVFIPILGWLVMSVAYILLLVLWIIGWVYALSGEEKEIPLIGKYAKMFKI